MRSAVVRQPGLLSMLSELNGGGVAVRRMGSLAFASGGLVDADPSGGSGPSGNATLTVGLDDGLLLKRL